MTTQDDIDTYFELSDSGDIVRIEPKSLVYPDAELDWDKNWIKTKITVRGGQFTGTFDAEFMTTDFEIFRQQFKLLYDNLKGNATFSGLERQLELKICGDGFGHFSVDVVACDKPNGSELSFTMSFDQTIIQELIGQLNGITKAFPIIGDCVIKNE